MRQGLHPTEPHILEPPLNLELPSGAERFVLLETEL